MMTLAWKPKACCTGIDSSLGCPSITWFWVAAVVAGVAAIAKPKKAA